MLNNIKFLTIGLLIIGLFSSCGGDECTADTLENAIVGKWTLLSGGQEFGEVEFKSDGTLEDPDNALISAEVNGVSLDDKSYTVSGNESITLRAEAGSSFQTGDIRVSSFDCDVILGEVFGSPIRLEKI